MDQPWTYMLTKAISAKVSEANRIQISAFASADGSCGKARLASLRAHKNTKSLRGTIRISANSGRMTKHKEGHGHCDSHQHLEEDLHAEDTDAFSVVFVHHLHREHPNYGEQEAVDAQDPLHVAGSQGYIRHKESHVGQLGVRECTAPQPAGHGQAAASEAY